MTLTESQRYALRKLARERCVPLQQSKVIGGYRTATLMALVEAGLAKKVKGKVCITVAGEGA